jgi:TonB family protein
MTSRILKNCVIKKLSSLFIVFTLLVPGIVLSQNEENPAYTVISVEVDGRSVESAVGIKFARYGNVKGAITPLAVNDRLSAGLIKTAINTSLKLRTLNGNTILLMPNTTLGTSALNRAGERYALRAGTAEFDVVAPLGFFQIDNARFAVAASDAKFRLQRINDDGLDQPGEMEVEVLRGKANVERLHEVSIGDNAQKPIVTMAEALSALPSLTTPSKTKLRFDTRKNVLMKFATVTEAALFFTNRADDAIKSSDDERIAEALRAQADFLSSIGKHRDAFEALQGWQAVTAGNNIAQYDAFLKMAEALIAQKEDSRAIAYLQLALKIIDGPYTSGPARSHAAVYQMISVANLRLESYATAQRYAALSAIKSQKYEAPAFKTATVISKGSTEFPKKMQQWGLDGNVMISSVLTADGRSEDLRVLKSIHPAFELAAIKGMMSIRVQPATLNEKPIPILVITPFSFMLSSSKKSSIAEHAAFSFPKVNSSKPDDERYDVAPEIRVVSLPAYPYALLMDRVTGSAKVSVTLDQLGMVKDVKVAEATHPEFGAATKAMMQNWDFSPALKAGKPISTQFRFEHQFQFNQRDNGIGDETLQAIRYVKSYPNEIYEIGALDVKPKTLYQPEASDPRVLSANANTIDTVQIEFIIDREGGVQLPRIVSATNMDLAWSVATVLQRWLFEVPKVKGTAVFARKEMLFEFR